MSGKLPKFLEGEPLPKGYYSPPNPYDDAPKCNVNLLELSRYARRCGKPLVELTKEEVNKFRVSI